MIKERIFYLGKLEKNLVPKNYKRTEMSENSSSYPVLGLNFSAMKALLDEGKALRQQLDQEKSELQEKVGILKKHVELAQHLSRTCKINDELYEKIASLSPTLESFNLQPNLKIIGHKTDEPSEQKERTEELKREIEEMESKIITLTQEKSSLAVEEQSLTILQSSLFNESSTLRQQCDELLQQRDAFALELSENEALLEFWRNKNSKSSSILKSSIQELRSLQNLNDADAIKLMNELAALYTALDGAAQKLRAKSI